MSGFVRSSFFSSRMQFAFKNVEIVARDGNTFALSRLSMSPRLDVRGNFGEQGFFFNIELPHSLNHWTSSCQMEPNKVN